MAKTMRYISRTTDGFYLSRWATTEHKTKLLWAGYASYPFNLSAASNERLNRLFTSGKYPVEILAGMETIILRG